MTNPTAPLSSILLWTIAILPAAQPSWLDVPFVPQRKNDDCGAAAMAMLMNYWRNQGHPPALDSDPEVIYRELHHARDKGILGSALRGYLERAGFHAFAIRGTWDDLTLHLARGRPLVVGVAAPLNGLHYVLVAGVDVNRDIVYVHDPARRKLLSIPRRNFEKDWRASGKWTLVATPAR